MPVIQRQTITSHTDVGRVRDHNEDSFTVNSDRLCFAVADGVAGAPHGEVASSIATRCVFMASTRGGCANAREVVETAFRMTSERLSRENDGEFRGMMTTLAVLCIDRRERKAVYGHVGDSRIYVRHRLKKRLLTNDHQDAWGQLSCIMATHMSHAPTIGELTVFDDDVFVLCTDGVSNEISGDDILKLGAQYGARTVVNKAVEAGGRDNATAIVVRVAL